MKEDRKSARRLRFGSLSRPGVLRLLGVAGVALLAVVIAAASPALAVCTDMDGDGYGSPGDAACPNGAAEDCDDGNMDVNPGAAELCDGIDNNCVGGIDEVFDVGDDCAVGDPPGCMDGDPGGCCLTLGEKVCTGDGLGTECMALGPIDLQEPEGPQGAPSCFDAKDNDCDNLIDHADEADCKTAEFCNGFDDDNDGSIDEDFPTLGDPCSAGTGACEVGGIYICTGDGMGVVCNATPGTGGMEGPVNGAKCGDGVDNDCDGLTDLADPSCQEAEKCDGLDNDGDSLVDEDFSDLGDPCTVGTGACQADGFRVCNGAKTGTECGVAPGVPSVEGPAGDTCTDAIDNDCDGLTDMDDPQCNSALLSVTCELDRGQPGSDCSGWFRIFFETSGHAPDADISAELLALDPDGTVLGSTPVENGQLAHLSSRLNNLKISSKNATHEVFAPVPMLRVTVDDGMVKRQAYCSNIPFLQVVEPADTVVTESQGNTTHVVAAIPIVDPASLSVLVNGVDILAELGIDPATDFPGGPFPTQTIMIGSEMVTVSDLVVDTAPPGEQSSNTLTMNLTNLGCGTNIVVVEGDVLPEGRPDPITNQCHVDDLSDRASSLVFTIDITSPAEGEVTAVVPTPVTGQVCHGREIASVLVNGLSLDTSGQVCTDPPGEDEGLTCTLPINTALDRTDLAQELATGAEPIYTLDEGSNRLVIDATDDMGNRTFASLIFATGSVSPVLSSLVTQEVEGALRSSLLELTSSMTALSDGVVAGMTPAAVQNFFSALCADAAPQFTAAINSLPSMIPAIPFGPIPIPAGVCDPTGNITVTGVGIQPGFDFGAACMATLQNDNIHVDVALPDLTIFADVDGYCKNYLDLLIGKVCFSEIIIDTTVEVPLNGMALAFDVSEDQLEMGGSITPILSPPPGPVSPVLTGPEPEINCIAGFIADVIDGISDVLEFFGFIDGPLLPTLGDRLAETDLSSQLNLSGLPTLPIPDLGFNQDIESFMVSLEANLSTIEIDPAGVTASFDSEFAPTMPAPDVAMTPGFVLTPAPAPMTPVTGADNAFLVLSDDLYNQLLASLTTAGKLQTGFEASGITVLDVFPSLNDPAFFLAKTALASKNIFATTELILQGRTEVPPRLLIQDDGMTPAVEVAARANDVSAALIADRNGSGMVEGDLESLPECLSPLAPTVGDCRLYEACLDLNVLATLEIQMIDAHPAIVTDVLGLLPDDLEVGVVCGAPFGGNDNPLIDESVASAAITDLLSTIELSVPPLEAEGFDMGGLLTFSNPRLIAIETDGDPTFGDYLGITGNIVP